ncbi:MAG: S9 family peptidase, partial [Acidimicrobiia bacterium]|nr:S9 family peptidase [Acidimicrobiia bacterium]
MTTAAPYGSWVSPIAPASLTHGAVGLGGLTADGEDLYWLEGRPTEGGRTVIVQRRPDNSITDITPPGFNSRTRIHEYGGGGYGVAGGMVLSCAFEDQRIWRLDQPVRTAITPEPQIEAGHRYGDFCFAGDRLICVRERHREQGEPVNEIVSLPLNGSDSPRVEVSGHDFYSTPCLSPNGRQLAWLAWNHPNMPWDGTELYVADIESGVVGEPVLVAGGLDESIF